MSPSLEKPCYELGIIIPVYRATEALPQLLCDIAEQLRGASWHAYIVDDSGYAPTQEFLDERCRTSRVTLLRLRQNSGQQNAVLCGIRAALGSCESFVTMDDDGQHPAALLPELLKALPEKNGLVYAAPRAGRGGVRSLGSAARDALFGFLFHLPQGVKVSSFRAFTPEVAQTAASFSGSFFYFSAWVLRAKPRLGCVFYEPAPRQFGKSGYTFKKLLYLYWGIVCHYLLFPKQREIELYEIQSVFEGEESL